MASKKKMPAGLLDPESERIAEAYAAIPSVKRQTSGLLSLEPQKEQNMGRAAFEMLASFIPGVSQALAARDLERARRANDPAAAALAATEFVPFGRLMNMGKRAGPVMSEIDVYHGSPHRFEEFDASKIGTGEGAQAYGYGLYLAENPSVARSYIKTPDDWAEQANIKNSPYRKAQAEIVRADRELRKQFPSAIPKNEISAFMYVENNQGMFPKETVEKIKNIRKAEEKAYKEFTSGSFYKADLPDEMVDRMLDWDKPLSEQPKAVRQALKNAGLTQYVDEMEASYLRSLPPQAQALALKMINGSDEMVIAQGKGFKGNDIAARNWAQLERLAPGIDHNQIHDIRDWYASKNGADLYAEMSQGAGGRSAITASDRLRQMGIPGIRYLDAGSRGQGGTGTRNFVVFPGEEKKVKIKKRE